MEDNVIEATTISGVVDARMVSPRANFLAGGRARRVVEVDRPYSDKDIVWQESVYEISLEIARKVQALRVVEIGCGGGVKLPTVFSDFPTRLFQVDLEDRREALSDSLAAPEFLRADLEQYADLEALEAALAVGEGDVTVYVISDVIEHLTDPRPLLRSLRRWLKSNPGNRAVFSTPDRFLIDGADSAAVPDNRGHVRQWTINEFGLLLLSSGFEVHRVGRVAQNSFDTELHTVIAEVGCNVEFYNRFLSWQALPPPGRHLIVTTEHAGTAETGGIGTYVELVEAASPLGCVILFAGTKGLEENQWQDKVHREGWAHVADIIGQNSRSFTALGHVDWDEILEAVVQLVFLYDDLRLVEYQDYLGIGLRVAQAKRAMLLPPSVHVLAAAHGNGLYLDAAAGEVSRTRPPQVDVAERLSVELADSVGFASRYLRDLYVGTGGFQLRNECSLPYPLSLDDDSLADSRRQPISKIAYYGRNTPQKGYADFCQAIIDLFDNSSFAEAAAKLDEVILMGIDEPDHRLLKLPVRLTCGKWDRQGAVSKLHDLAASTLVTLPYRGDNHPLAISEVVGADCQLIAYRAGGIPENIASDIADSVLCEPNPLALTAAIARHLLLTHWDRCELVRKTRSSMRALYDEHRETYETAVRLAAANAEPIIRPASSDDLTVLIPTFNGDPTWLQDAAFGIVNSTHRPARVVIVDDHSADADAVSGVARASFHRIPLLLVRNDENRGLAASRNRALDHVETPYVCAHDDDNLVRNAFFRTACAMLDGNPDVAAVTSWSHYFDDKKPWNAESSAIGYRPIGADLGLALCENQIGDALAVYRVDVLRKLGGWDASSRAQWEDWQLFIRMLAAGHDIWVIPREMTMYRVRENSMVRTSAEFPGWLRLAEGLEPLPRSQRLSVLRVLWNGPPDELNRLRSIEASTIWRSTRPLRRALQDHPTFARWARSSLTRVVRIGRAAKRRPGF